MLGSSRPKCIDFQYCGHKSLAAVYLIKSQESGEAALFDCGTPGHYQIIIDEIKKSGAAQSLKSIFITHHHMDHSANASLFIKNFPDVKIYCGTKTAKLLMNPDATILRMKAASGRRYKAEFGNNVFPIPRSYIHALEDGDIVKLAKDLSIQAIYTPGHCDDHFCFLDSARSIVYTGDAFGNFYSNVSPKIGIMSFPDGIDIETACNSIKKVAKCGAKTAALAHFGFVDNVPTHAEQCIYWTERMYSIGMNSSNVDKGVYDEYVKHFGSDFSRRWHRLNGHCRVNTWGARKVALKREPSK